jgi:hypothetical protein
MPKLGTFLRRLLARRGYVVTRVEPEVPPSVSTYLRKMRMRTTPPTSVVCFDNEVSIQAEILEVFPEDRVSFSCPLFMSKNGAAAQGSILPTVPSERFAVVVDIETHSIELLFEKLPRLREAEILLLRARLGSFWAGEIDLCLLANQIQSFGWQLADVIGLSRLPAAQAPSGRVILACERCADAPQQSWQSRYREVESLSFLSAPIAQRNDFQLLAGRGSFGYDGGVFNPGAIVENERTYLISNADRTPWALQKVDECRFFASTHPLLLELDHAHCIAGATELDLVDLPSRSTKRIGDFRLFKFGGTVFSNHFVISNTTRDTAEHRPLRLEDMQTRIGISRLDFTGARFHWCGFPTLDRSVARAEKNWAMFANGGRVLLLYSFAPYVLLACEEWPSLKFTTVLDARFVLPFDGDGLMLRNSINPVEYDDEHWLHVVHKVYPSKQYSFWAVLLCKRTLQPVRATARPLVCGWRSYSSSIIYTCSVIAGPRDILLFSGLDDSATAFARIPRSRLDAEWVPIERADA